MGCETNMQHNYHKYTYKNAVVMSDNCDEVASRVVNSHQSHKWQVIGTFIGIMSQRVGMSSNRGMKDLKSKAKSICKKTQIQLQQQHESVISMIYSQYGRGEQF